MNWNLSSSASTVSFGPAMFRESVSIVQIKKDEAAFARICESVKERSRTLDSYMDPLARANNVMSQEIRSSMKLINQHDATEGLEDEKLETAHLASDNQFLRVSFRALSLVRDLFRASLGLVKVLDPQGLYLPPDGMDSIEADVQKMQQFAHLNGQALERYAGALFGISAVKAHTLDYAYEVIKVLDGYYRDLVKRHSIDGLQIHGDPILTDVALSIFENIDLHGEIDAGDNPDSVSAYTRRKAQILARALSDEPLGSFARKQGYFIQFLCGALYDVWGWSEKLEKVFAKHIAAAANRWEPPYARVPQRAELEVALQNIADMDPSLVKYKDRAVLLTPEERFQNKFVNETLAGIVEILRSDDPEAPLKVVQYVLQRRAELGRHNLGENTFYICRMGVKNQLNEKAHGQLTVVPGERPKVSIEEIWGSGFQEIKEHVESIELGSKWHDLFVATSPSRTADKSNVLMIGPQGCGKSQVLRAIGADRGSISVFAQGSDFLTCWLGEAEKNPKRLFEGAVKLQKESGKHVYILLDEADSVMKKQELKTSGEVDLTLEFQILMDGVVHYPNLTIVAATNSPGRMPMTMIRRFSKVLIVGELCEEDRRRILKHYVEFMPTKGFEDRHWAYASQRLDGATGDVIRKVVDHIWRQKMTWFVKHQPERAEEMLKWLNSDSKFDISEFPPARRQEFKRMLGPHVHIEPVDLDKSVDMHLKNVGINGEIQTARATYKEAHELLDSLDSSGLIL